MSELESVILEHTRFAIRAAFLTKQARAAKTKREAQKYIVEKNKCLKKIERFRRERMRLSGR